MPKCKYPIANCKMFAIEIKSPAIFGCPKFISLLTHEGSDSIQTFYDKQEALKVAKNKRNAIDYYQHDIPKNMRSKVKVITYKENNLEGEEN